MFCLLQHVLLYRREALTSHARNDKVPHRALLKGDDQWHLSLPGTSVQRLLEGVTFRDEVTHIDAHGTVTELFDQRWNWHKDPLAFT